MEGILLNLEIVKEIELNSWNFEWIELNLGILKGIELNPGNWKGLN